MRPIIVATVDDAPAGAPSADVVLVPSGGNDIRHVLHGDKAPIHLTSYRLAPGTRLEWTRPERCRTLFVQTGALMINGQKFGPDSVIVVESDGHCMAEAGPDGAAFHEFLHHRERSPHRGGKVHAIAGGESPVTRHDGIDSALPADSTCPGCGVWLQDTFFHVEGRLVDLHSHTEDEVIFVLEGELLAGPRKLGPGSALSVAKNIVYSFTVGKGGLRFINYRPSRPYYVAHGSDEVRDERGIYANLGVTPGMHMVL